MIKNRHLTNFAEQKIKEIKWWAWAAAVLPLTALSGLFFLWAFGWGHLINGTMVVGATVMFGIAVGWWWWALHTMNSLVRHWDETRSDVKDVLVDTQEVRKIVKELIKEEMDK